MQRWMRGGEGRKEGRRAQGSREGARQPKSSKVTNEDAGVKGSDGRKGGGRGEAPPGFRRNLPCLEEVFKGGGGHAPEVRGKEREVEIKRAFSFLFLYLTPGSAAAAVAVVVASHGEREGRRT